ncbi:MAG TPA: hypothetical protein PLU22_27865, partial [Polyangiaceae bacterium]|nr:hypothetical protein [Polyangiaceae bacterium]
QEVAPFEKQAPLLVGMMRGQPGYAVPPVPPEATDPRPPSPPPSSSCEQAAPPAPIPTTMTSAICLERFASDESPCILTPAGP